MATFAQAMKRAGDVAAELAEIYGVPISKALNPLKKKDFITLVNRTAERLDGASIISEQEAIAAALDVLDVDWSAMSANQIDATIAAAEAAILKVSSEAMPKINMVLSTDGLGMAKLTRSAAKSTWDLDIESTLQQRDLEAEKAIRTTTSNFIRDQFGVRAGDLSAEARDVVANGLSQGLDPHAIGIKLEDALGDRVMQSEAYYQVVASAYCTKGRTYSQLYSLDDAGVEEYEFDAVLDEVTTDVCRFYHGKVFKVGAGIKHVEALNEETDPEKAVAANPWVRKGKNEDGDSVLWIPKGEDRVTIATITRSGVGSSDDTGEYSGGKSADQLTDLGIPWPPLHGHCRSTIVPKF